MHGPQRLGKHDRQGQVNKVRFVHFFDDNTLVSVAEYGSAKFWDSVQDAVEVYRFEELRHR